MNRFSAGVKEHYKKDSLAIPELMRSSNIKITGILLSLMVGFIVSSLILGFQLLAIGIILALFLVASIFLKPMYFILFWLVFAVVSDKIQIAGYDITSYGLLNLLFLPFLSFKVLFSARQEFLRFPGRISYSLFLFLLFLSIWYSPQPYIFGIRKYFNFIIPFLISLLMICTIRFEREPERFLKITLISVATIGILGTVMYYLHYWVVDLEEIPRARGLLHHPNDYAFFLNMNLAFPLSLAFLLKQRSARIFYAILASLILVSIIPTFSKTGYIGAFMILFGVSFMLTLKKRTLKPLAIGILCIVAILLVVSLSVHSSELSYRLANQETFQSRMAIWEGVMQKFYEHPIIGNGIEASMGIVKSLGFDSMDPSEPETSTHNLYLMLLLDIGIIGTLSFMFFYFSVLVYAFRIFLSSPDQFTTGVSAGFVVSTATILVMSFSEKSFFGVIHYMYFWFFLSFLICFNRREQIMDGTVVVR